MADLGTDVAGIGAYLSTHRLAIPEYQRSYAWGLPGERDEVQDLWDDLERAIRERESDYFLGAVVTITGESRTIVIDGQQRLATISLMFAALRDLFASRSDERSKEIETKFLGEKSFGTRELTQYLVLNEDDNDLFRQLTLVPIADRSLKPTLASHKRLIYAYEFFAKRFGQLIDGLAGAKWADPLSIWYDYVWQKALILEVSVPNESRGFVIFETLNDRGLNLSTADLLKNHLFGTAGKRLKEVKVRWGRTVAPFDDPDVNLDLDVFLRQFWASRKGVVRVKGLFTQIKPDITTPTIAVDFASDLEEGSQIWTAMFNTGHERWKKYRAASLAALDALRNLNVEQCRPLLLAVIRKLAQSDVERILPLIVNWSVRWLVVGGGSAGTTERLYAETARKVTDGTIKDAAEVIAEFDTRVPSDLAFEQAFETLTVRRSWLSRYYLYVLERALLADPEPELVPNENVEQVNLEHVLPRNPDASWTKVFTQEEAQLMTFLVGNQCLLAKGANAGLGNRPFSVKKPILAGSKFSLTQQVGTQKAWTPDAIRARQKKMAKLAASSWKKS